MGTWTDRDNKLFKIGPPAEPSIVEWSAILYDRQEIIMVQWDDLPPEIHRKILNRLDTLERCNLFAEYAYALICTLTENWRVQTEILAQHAVKQELILL